MVGKSVECFAKRASVEKVLATDKEVLHTKMMRVTEETGDISNSVSIQALSFKFPWYYEDTVIGIFGCSIKMNGLGVGELAYAFSQLITTGLLGSAHSLPMTMSSNYQLQLAQLTEREKQVLSLLVRGKTAKEIGNRLGISRRTVEHHIESLKFKTNSKFKSDLIDKFID
ncbi:MAG: helix-turn-helix transcriptional regulator [Gammaproteobacteria bacterium]|nr:helix-turn-helix transcriptional regulator [Gammaproteobacteria bacterium]